MWRKPLAKKQQLKARREEREANYEAPKAEEEILYVHNADLGVSLPPRPDAIFAVFRL